MNHPSLRLAAPTALAMLLAACGSDSANNADDTASTAGTPSPQVSQGAATSEQPDAAAAPSSTQAPGTQGQTGGAAAFELTVADLELYEQGLRREIELLRSARERVRQTSDSSEQLEILGEIQPAVLRREGAAAAGTSEQHYARVQSAISDVLGKHEMGAATRQMMPSEADLANMPAEIRARVEQNMREMQAAFGDPYEGLSDDVADALRQRLDEFAQLRAEHIGLLVP